MHMGAQECAVKLGTVCEGAWSCVRVQWRRSEVQIGDIRVQNGDT